MEICKIDDPSAFMHIGDDYYSDVVGAHRAGWSSVLISSEVGNPSNIIQPTIKVSCLEELYDYFIKLL